VEGDFKYLEYLNKESAYYEKQKPKDKTPFAVKNLPQGWQISTEDSFWTMVYVPNQAMIVQGFKIHISTTFEKADETLDIVASILFEAKISFKHVKDQESLYNMYSKHGSRISAGKFITIYPNEDEFIPTLNHLSDALANMPKGPYILTDKRYKDSNVYYRYGAFRDIKDENGVACILDAEGKMIPDLREPRFCLPDFVSIPEEILDEDKKMTKNSPNTPSRLQLYSIEKVIRFSNAGGIYIGTRKEDGKKCVIKEARKQIGLDGQRRNAEYRLNVEYEALTRLRGVDGVVQTMDYFNVWENIFLVIEFVDGVSLHTWMAQNYPFSAEIDTSDYFDKVADIINQLKSIIEAMHEKGVAMCDIQTQNILVDENLKIKIIDFETAEPADADSTPALATRGFANVLNTKAKDRDWYSLNRLFQFLLLPLGAVYDIDMKVNKDHVIWVYNNYNENNFKYFYDFQMEIKTKIEKFDNIFKTTYEDAKELIIKGRALQEIDVSSIENKVINGLLSNVDNNNPALVNGDIRQFETDCGLYNIQNGGFGAVLTLMRTKNLNNAAKSWIEKHVDSIIANEYNNGYLTGKSGIACVLYEAGYKKEGLMIMQSVINTYDHNDTDISLRSGLSGIGLALAAFYKETGNAKFLIEAEKICKQVIEQFINLETLPKGKDWQSINLGLFDGYSGISLFLSALYNATGKSEYINASTAAIQKDLENSRTAPEDGSLQILDARGRLLPYLSLGSIGVGVAIQTLNNLSGQLFFESELKAISGVSKCRLSIEPGIFEGVAGMLFINCFTENKSIIKDTLAKLNLFLIEYGDMIFMPGRMFYKFSSDVHTGIAGVLLALQSARHKDPTLWLPTMGVFNYTKILDAAV